MIDRGREREGGKRERERGGKGGREGERKREE